MNSPSPTSRTTPIHVPTARWLHAFTYTPDSTRIRTDSTHHPAAGHDISSSSEDALPTQFHSPSRARAVSGGPQPGCDRAQGNSPEGCVHVSTPASTVPAKRKRQSREVLSSAPGNTANSLSATLGSSTQRRTGKTRPRTQATSTVRGSDPDRNHDRGLSSSHSPASSTRSRSCHMVLDAVEIISKRRSQGYLRTVCDECPTKSVHKSAISHYPTPPVSRAPKDVMHKSSSRPVTDSPDPTSPLKTSKYFARVSTPPTRPVSKCTADLTPPSSPILTIPVYIESSDFECSPLDVSFDEPLEDPSVDEPGCIISSLHNNSELFDDLMIMLRRLKPILVQESVRDDPWKVLIAVRLLNVTTGKVAIPVFCKIISRWPTPQDLAHASQDELLELLRPLGLYNKRARWLKDVSEYFLEDQEGRSSLKTSFVSLSSEEYAVPAVPHLHYPGVGPYAMDSLRIFCADDKDAWKWVMPRDKELVRYLRWRWAVEEGKVWYPAGIGVIGDIDVPYLITLVDQLAIHYDSTIGGEGTSYTITPELLETSVILGDSHPSNDISLSSDFVPCVVFVDRWEHRSKMKSKWKQRHHITENDDQPANSSKAAASEIHN